MEEVFVPILAMATLFIGLPWLVLHYLTKWRATSGLTAEDENLLDELYELGRRLDERMVTIERILQAENPNWDALTRERPGPRLEKSDVREFTRPAPGDRDARSGDYREGRA